MSLSLTNRDDIIANSYSLITSDGVVDLLDVVGGTLSTATLAAINVSVDAKITAIVGAAPAALNTLVELSAALGDDHNYATTITTALAAKAPKASPTFTGTAIAPQIMFDYNSNAPTLTTRSEGTKLVLYPSITSAQADYAIGVEGSNMWLSVADAGNGFKFYGKTTNVATISGNGNFSCNGGVACSGLTVSGALLVGTTNVATALGEKATITDLDLKAPKASPAFTGTATAANLTVNGPFRVIGNSTIIDNALTVGVGVPSTENALSILGNSLLTGNLQVNANITCNGALTVASTNVLTALGEKATTANLDLKAPKASPAFTGALTCAGTATLGGALTVSGSRDDVASNITNSQLNGFSSLYFNNTSGASASEVGRIYCGQTVGLNLTTNTAHPIRFTTYSNASTQFISILPSMEILGTGNRDVEISAPLKIKCLLTTIEQAVVIGGAAPVEATGLYVSNNAVINRNLTVVGNLTVSGFYPIKPYAALYVVGNAISTSTAVGFLAPSAFTMTRTGGNYGFTFATPHPNGNNFQIFATPRTAGGTTPFFTCTAKVETDTTAGTKFSVWCRNASNAIIDGDFWVHTVP